MTAMKPDMSKQERAFAIAAARAKIEAFRVDPAAVAAAGFSTIAETHAWAYFAEETRSYWLVTSDALVALADMDVETWAESDATAKEWGPKAPRKAGD